MAEETRSLPDWDWSDISAHLRCTACGAVGWVDTKPPRKTGNTEPWQHAAKVLHQAAEHGGRFVFMARINFYRAVHGETPPPIGNPEGGASGSWRGIGDEKAAPHGLRDRGEAEKTYSVFNSRQT